MVSYFCGLERTFLQIENEYETEGKEFGAAGSAYMNWAAKMAVETDTGVPWVMCKEDDAPDPMVRISFCKYFHIDFISSHAWDVHIVS